MQRLFNSKEKTTDNESKKLASRGYLYCIGNHFALLHPYLDCYRSAHAQFEPTGENVLRQSFPTGAIQLFLTFDTAKTVSDIGLRALSLKRAMVPPNNEFRQVQNATTIFRVAVNDVSHLKKAVKLGYGIDEMGHYGEVHIRCLQASIEHISEITSVNLVFESLAESGEYTELSIDLRDLSKDYLQDKQVALKRDFR